MDARIEAQALGVGEYDLTLDDGTKPRYIDLYDADSGLVRISVARDVPPESLELKMGDPVVLRCTVGNAEKVVRGEERDRTVKSVRLQAVEIINLAAGATKKAA
jgi:hypothetical protein